MGRLRLNRRARLAAVARAAVNERTDERN